MIDVRCSYTSRFYNILYNTYTVGCLISRVHVLLREDDLTTFLQVLHII